MEYGGAVVGSGLLAGCFGDNGSEPTENTADTTYTATMEPVGTLECESVPQSFVGGWGAAADVMTALGQGEKIIAAEGPQFWFTGFYDKLPGVSVPDPDSLDRVLTEDWGVRKELLYELDPDLLATDPNRYIAYYGSDKDEVQEIHDTIAPFFGNVSRRKRGDGWPNWPNGESYPYYTIPEFVERYGELFQASERATALNEFYRTAQKEMRSRVPSESDKPTVAVLNARNNPETAEGFTVYNPDTGLEKTYGKKQYRDMEIVDAFDGQYDGQSGITIGYEGLLEADPDIIILHFAVNYRDWDGKDATQATVEELRSSSLGQKLTAVQEDNVFIGGTPYQGPIINLFQTEMLGKQLYPDEFGEWPGDVTDDQLPDIPAEEQLFDRDALAEIITGDN
ncbi:ABC transporter substrate-binding protein [Natrinema salsiterrestre]|uniref:ABC transporter substrate-binding protein n=1 Tax=Natrinema salsiterrestre TaxID=2950540 RepID=A0A9Q4L820_9EURY|nr:ABC transporter substrate-binding protein [Natrinema salsiterrestre]MDF9748257.1 ABC transporter substrate-binding protein [Natrinema salsiterrestre]